MKLVGENYNTIDTTKALTKELNVTGLHYWEYNFKMQDFHLVRRTKWNVIKGPTYILKIGNHHLEVPATHFIMLGDFDGGIDYIRVNEITNREFEVFSFSSKLEPDSWVLADMRVVGYKEESKIVFPETTNGVVVQIGGGMAVILSTIDLYNKSQGLSFSDFV